MAKQVELFGVQYKEGSLEPKTAEFIKFAVNLAIGHEHGRLLRGCTTSPRKLFQSN
jgi:hypothetical protein